MAPMKKPKMEEHMMKQGSTTSDHMAPEVHDPADHNNM
jgi:hypothetical protein